MLRTLHLAAGRVMLPLRLRRLPPLVAAVFRNLQPGWLVGECVGELLQGRQPSRWEVVTALPPPVVRLWLSRIRLPGEAIWEPAAAPTEAAESTWVQREGEAVVVSSLPGLDLTAHLAGRGLTVAAMALSPSGRLFDPLGGLQDLRRGVLRVGGHSPDAPGRWFDQNPVRLWQAVRVAAAQGLELHPATWAAIRTQADRLSPGASGEDGEAALAAGVRDEALHLLMSRRPAWGLEEARKLGLVAATLPELLPMVGCPQNRFHAYPVWEHSLLTVAGVPPRPALRLAALLHDVGKPHTATVDAAGERHFYGHSQVGAEVAERFLQRLQVEPGLRDRVVRLVRHHMDLRWDPAMTDAAVRRMVRRIGRDNLEDQLALWVADGRATGRARVDPAGPAALLYKRVRELEEGQTVSGRKQLAVDGRAVMAALGEGPGPRIGAALAWLLTEVEAGRVANHPAALVAHLRHWPQR